MLQSSSQGALLRHVLQVFTGSDALTFRKPHPVLGQLDTVKQPGRSALLRFIVGAYFQNIRKGDQLVVDQCPLCEEKWQYPTIHLFGNCTDSAIYTARQSWLKDGGIYTPNEWTYKYIAESLGIGSNQLPHRLLSSAKFALSISNALASVYKKRCSPVTIRHKTGAEYCVPSQEL